MNDYKRREFIKLSALGFAGIALQLNSISAYAQAGNAHFGKWHKDTQLNWDAFLERLTQLAQSQHQSPWNQKLYSEQVKQLLLQCNFPEFENIKKEMEAYEDKNPNWFEAASLHREVDFQVSLFQFEKGEYIPHHDHPDMTGVINVVSGNILAKNYSVEEQLSTTREVIENGRKEILRACAIREVGNEINQRGDVSILTADEGNIHSLMPNEFTQLIDVFTPAYKPDTKSIWYTVNEEGFYQGQENVFEAEYSVKGEAEIKTINLGKKQMDLYVGSYQISDENFIKIFRKDQELFLERTKNLDAPGSQKKLLAYEETKFWVEGQDVRCHFNMTDAKAPESLTIHFGEMSVTGNRIK